MIKEYGWSGLSILVGCCIQVFIVWAMRIKNYSFWMMIPVILLCQYLFFTAYAKAPSFSIIWFIATLAANFTAIMAGRFLFGDVLTMKQYVGLALLFTGVIVISSPT